MDYTNKSLGLRVQTQIPLDVKEYIASEAALKNLGVGNNLAFTYIKGLIIYCILEGTRYEWKEIEIGDIGLLDDNFVYPDNIITFGIDYSNKEYNFVKLKDIPIIDGSETKINAGTNISISGNGTISTPYIINNTQNIDGTETKINSGTNISITGNGSIGTPFVINNTQTIDGSETKLNSGTTTTVTGNGTTTTPYNIEIVNLQKIIPAANYVLSNADNNYIIFINNASTDITITIPAGLITKFQCGFIQQGAGIVTFVSSGTTINTPIGLKIKGQNYNAFIEKVLSTEVYHLLGDLQI